MHDLGHPPFGHNGEYALDSKMQPYGGFEGNAQTLRIITRLEKKVRRENCGPDEDPRKGLNLTYRTIASALKYDNAIPQERDGDVLVKGYYADEQALVERIKDSVAPGWRSRGGKFKTIECAIMDIADDIAYSTYDLEDSLKAGFLTPGAILASEDELLQRVAKKVARAVGRNVDAAEVLAVLMEVFSDIVRPEGANLGGAHDPTAEFIRAYRASENITHDGHTRTALTTQLVSNMVRAVEVEVDETVPALSCARLSEDALLQVEVLKNYTFEATIYSTRLKVAEYRGRDIVSAIFDALAEDKGRLLMPDDIRALYDAKASDKSAQMRVVCDFIAGMTDRYAVEFYSRLHSENGQTIFKPV